jgi:hypothetical protein
VEVQITGKQQDLGSRWWNRVYTAQIHKNIRHVIDAQKIRHVIDAAFSKNAFWAYILAKNGAYI